MVYYVKKDENGRVVGAGTAPSAATIPEGHIKATKAEYEGFFSTEALYLGAGPGPTPEERMRADIDFLAALQGVSL